MTNLEPVGFADPDPVCIDVIAVPEPKTVKNRVHLDLATTSAALRRTCRAPRSRAGRPQTWSSDVSWTVLADPAGKFAAGTLAGRRDTANRSGAGRRVDPQAVALILGEAMDWTLHQVSGDHAVLRSAKGAGPYLQFLRTPDMKTVKNRVHLTSGPTLVTIKRRRSPVFGPRRHRFDVGPGGCWTVLADPEGSEFCVLTPR